VPNGAAEPVGRGKIHYLTKILYSRRAVNDIGFMTLAALGGLSNYKLSSPIGNTIQSTRPAGNSSGASGGASLDLQPSDTSQLSPLGQILSTLQQAQQSGGSLYQQLTQEVAAGLQQTAQGIGDSKAANLLNQIAGDFTQASKTGAVPDISNLANAVSADGLDSFSLQIGYSETAISATQGSAAAQYQEASLSVQVIFTESSSDNAAATQPASSTSSASSQLPAAQGQDLLKLLEQLLEKAAQAGQTNNSGSSLASSSQAVESWEIELQYNTNSTGSSTSSGLSAVA
jgi:hypothetical protein